MNRLPLSALLSQVLGAFTLDFEDELAAAGHGDVTLALGSNVLRFLDPDRGVRIGAIADLAGVSKQAVSQQLPHLERIGQVEVEPDPRDGRAKVVRLTPEGLVTRDAARRLFAVVEGQWARRHGDDTIRTLRLVLEDVTATLGRDLPHFPVDDHGGHQ